jgi:hypothetical protein
LVIIDNNLENHQIKVFLKIITEIDKKISRKKQHVPKMILKKRRIEKGKNQYNIKKRD